MLKYYWSTMFSSVFLSHILFLGAVGGSIDSGIKNDTDWCLKPSIIDPNTFCRYKFRPDIWLDVKEEASLQGYDKEHVNSNRYGVFLIC